MENDFISEVFAPGGAICRFLAGYEQRVEQVEMARAAAAAFEQRKRLAVEAGTGVGKSFAYLVPAIDLVRRGQGKVLVSTYTITLQEQLINKDLPVLASCTGVEFSAVLAKGRGNYLCKRRLEYAVRRQRGLFDESAEELERLAGWAQQTENGSLSELESAPSPGVWDAVRSEHGNCRGRKCPHYGKCFYWRARRMLDKADIIVANHALMFSDLVLKEQDVSLLPAYDYIVIDEAHNLEHVAEKQFGIDISNHRVKWLLDGLYNPRARKGLLAYRRSDPATDEAMDRVAQTTAAARGFFRDVADWYEQSGGRANGRCEKDFVKDRLSGPLRKLKGSLSKMAKQSEDEDERFEVLRFVDHCAELLADLKEFLGQQRDDYVYWVEAALWHGHPIRSAQDGPARESTTSRGRKSVRGSGRGDGLYLRSAALNVGADVKRCLFEAYGPVVLTSATLSSGPAAGPGKAQVVHEARDFAFFAGRVGLEDYDALKLGSPYDYPRQVTVYVERDLPEPNDGQFIAAAAEAVKRYVARTQGRAFVLFTSYDMLKRMAGAMAQWFIDNDIELLEQGSGRERGQLLRAFTSGGAKCLFGTDSFWQGVDVPGVALSNVMIVRLPFAVPNQPLLAGRLDQIRRQGGNPFMDYQLPSAIIKFKQGFGRLIRSKTDTGIVVILDSRIVQKRYGREFLEAIPQCPIRIEATDFTE
ncbi:MAG TPA: helicase [Phycisphaerales bacterium]|nr:helicase [Phycisphaerales bacterium]